MIYNQCISLQTYFFRIPIANILSEEDQKRCGRVKRDVGQYGVRKKDQKTSSKENVNKRYIRQSGYQYDNSGFDYNYDYGSDDESEEDQNKKGGFFSNFFNWNRYSDYNDKEIPTTQSNPKKVETTTKSLISTGTKGGFFANILEEIGFNKKPSLSKVIDSSQTNSTSIVLISQNSETTTKSKPSTLSPATVTTEKADSIPIDYEYDCGNFCGDYDYTFESKKEEEEHKNFGGFGALFSTLKTVLSFATLDRCQKNIAYKIPLDQYCSYVKDLETKCFEQSLLEMWNYDDRLIKGVTEEEIIWSIHQYDRSPYFGYAFNYSTLLGGIKGNESHEVITAASAMYNLATTVDLSRIVSSSSTQNAGTEFFPLDKENLIWQEEMIKVSFFRSKKS